MAKLIFVLYKRQDMSADEFRSYWKETHAELAKKIPGARKYLQNHAVSDPEGEAPRTPALPSWCSTARRRCNRALNRKKPRPPSPTCRTSPTSQGWRWL
jgi:uncharacterized protein (TIGR02118 family)